MVKSPPFRYKIPLSNEFLLFEAFVLFRQDRFQFVEEIILKINPDKLSENRKTIFFKLKADWLHHQENFWSV